MRSVEYFNKIFGRKAEHTTAVSNANRIMQENSSKLNKDHPTRHFDGNFCSCSHCRRFQSQKDMAMHRHAQQVENSKRKRGEPTSDLYGYLRPLQ